MYGSGDADAGPQPGDALVGDLRRRLGVLELRVVGHPAILIPESRRCEPVLPNVRRSGGVCRGASSSSMSSSMRRTTISLTEQQRTALDAVAVAVAVAVAEGSTAQRRAPVDRRSRVEPQRGAQRRARCAPGLARPRHRSPGPITQPARPRSPVRLNRLRVTGPNRGRTWAQVMSDEGVDFAVVEV